MNCCLVVQTCDKYQKFWEGFFNFMKKHWSEEIPCKIYFCNEEDEVYLPWNFRPIKTGKGTFVSNLKKILEEIPEDNIFYMLEDFWPISPMTADLFTESFDFFLKQDLDALQISSFLPYYTLENSEHKIAGSNIFKFSENSDWIFNFQARFWKKNSLYKCLREPTISESVVNSAITVEIESDKFAKENFKLNCFLHHYFWYPITGVSYRGEFTEIGNQMQNIVEIDKMVRDISQQV
jgi:hypothetical protein